MDSEIPLRLSPTSFLQTFATRSIKIAGQLGCTQCNDSTSHIERIGLAASSCLEDASRQQLGLPESIDHDQYADVIINLKNQIGGNFSRGSSEPGTIRVVNSRCPFGDMVKEAPELCRMTASVFGAIAARNFGYAKVELRKRIATNDPMCDVRIYTDPQAARDKAGDEYRSEGDHIVAKSAQADVIMRVERMIEKAWCPTGSRDSNAPQVRTKIIAESQSMRDALEAVEVVAPTTATVLITGETGVGKEVIARAVHALSARWNRELVAVNCGGIPENLIESVLFGHEKGAFTNAYDVHHGFFERAEKGTLFLDEIDCLPLPAQTRLLRVLQEGEFERVGGRRTLFADVRIVAASSHDVERMVSAGEFRRDLFYRLNVVPIHIPPLRERRDDIAAFVNHFLRRLSEKYDKPRKVLGERAWMRVLTYEWPGNLRELENVLERAFLFADGFVIDNIAKCLPDGAHGSIDSGVLTLRDAKRQAAMRVEAEVITEGLAQFRGNVSAVARFMGITPRAVHMKLKAHGIDAAVYRSRAPRLHVVRARSSAGSQAVKTNRRASPERT